MSFSQIQYARLDRDKIARLHQLEEELDSWIVAVEPVAELANLTEEQMRVLKTLEQELGVVLLAYKENSA
jgi:hypothetical protein